MDTDQYDDVAKSMTALFADWAFAFLEKIFTLLSSKYVFGLFILYISHFSLFFLDLHVFRDKGEKSPGGEWWMARLMEVRIYRSDIDL